MYTLPPPGTLHPAPFLLRKLRDGTFSSSFFLYSHTAEDVAIAVQDYVSPPPDGLTNDQRQALATYNNMRNQTAVNFESRSLLLENLHVFDKLFFFGALAAYCDLRIVNWLPHNRIGEAAYFKKRGTTVLDRQFEVEIRILDCSIIHRHLPPQERLDRYLGIILHEALHAMFGLHVCQDHTPCQLNKFNAIGNHGHKICWQKTAEEIEKTTRNLRMARSLVGLAMGIKSSVQDHEGED